MNDLDKIKLKTWHLLKEEMSPEEVEEFLKEIEADETISETVTGEVVRHAARVNLKERLQQIHIESQNTASSNRRIWYSVAAVILILMLPFLYWQIGESQGVYNKYFEPYRTTPLVRGDTSFGTDSWKKSLNAYSDDDFEKSIELMEELVLLNEKPVYQFYLAVSYMSLPTPQVEKSIPFLEEIVSENPPELIEQTRWYLALAYWKNDQFEEAKKMFTIVAKTDAGFKGKEAEKILKLWDD